MSITVLSDLIMPNEVIAAGIRGKNMRTNSRIQHGETGYMTINAVSSQALREYEAGIVPMKLARWQQIQAIHEITMGGAYGFLIEDPSDSEASRSSIALVPAAGAAAAYYQLQRRYVEQTSGRYWDRPITRPQASSFQLFQANGSPFAGSYTLDSDTGRITASVDPSTLTWSGHFYVPVHFESDVLDWDLILPGDMDHRLISGASVILKEIRE